MATKPNPAKPPAREEESAEPKEEAAPKKASLLSRLNPLAFFRLPLLQKLMVAGGLLVVLAGAWGGYDFLAASLGGEHTDAEAAVHAPASELPPPNAAF